MGIRKSRSISTGTRGPLDSIKGLTLLELLLSTLLLSVVFLGVSALYVASQKLFFTQTAKVAISSELQYAMEHIYKNAMQGIGDAGNPPYYISASDTLEITMNESTTYTYKKVANQLRFYNGGSNWESLAPKIDVSKVEFSMVGNLLTISIEGRYRDQILTLYGACYPRPASFK